MRKTAQFIEGQKARNSPQGRRTRGSDKQPRKMAAASLANLANGKDTQFKPGESGNPGGLPGVNVSERISRTVLARYEPEIVEGLGKKLCAGDGYVFGVVADRADGKTSQHLNVNVSGKVTLKQMLEAEERAKKHEND